MPVADKEAVLREAPLHSVQRAVQVLLRCGVRALGRREARTIHPVVDLQRPPHDRHAHVLRHLWRLLPMQPAPCCCTRLQAGMQIQHPDESLLLDMQAWSRPAPGSGPSPRPAGEVRQGTSATWMK